MPRCLRFILSAWLCLPIASALSTTAHGETFDEGLQPFLAAHCFDCHGNGANEGGLDLEKLSSDLTDERTMAAWVRIYDRVQSGEMPPEDVEQPADNDRQKFGEALHKPLADAHAAQKATVMRRLNRREYENTLNDLFGTKLDLKNRLPEDGRSHEFDNVGDALSLSMVHLQRYIEATEAVLDAAIEKQTAPPESKTKRASYADTRGAEKFLGNQWLELEDGAVVFYRASGYPSGMLREANVDRDGFYKVRVTGYAYQSDKPITFEIGATTFARGAEQPTFGYFSLPPGKPTTVEVKAFIERRYMISVTPFGIDDKNEIRKSGIEKYQGPGLAILHIEVEGPITEQFPSRGHHLIFDGVNRKEIEPNNPADKKKRWYQPKFEIATEDPSADAETVLTRVATKAFRRPVTAEQVAPYLQLFESELQQGGTFEASLRTAVTAIFCSTEFLYLRENEGWLGDYALATRLAYFLTRTTPDEQLLAAAASGNLSKDPAVLLEQTERLLDDPRSERFIDDFTDAWLNLRDIDFTAPDRRLFPEFDQYLQHSMIEETRAFFRELTDQDLGVRNVISSDFAMLNERLAEHYGIEGVDGPKLRRVSIPKESVRGGFLSQASVHKVSANGTNTSPVVRGVWVTERILGKHAPPPPPGVPGVEPDIRSASTLRELLDKHRSLQSCRNCHAMIDPPGFALENFNPIGGWRERYRSLGEGEKVDGARYRLGRKVDAAGELVSGEAFAGYIEFRDMLAEDEDRLAKALTKKLLTFSTGREMGFSDRTTIDQIVAKSAAEGHGVRNLIRQVVLSDIFRRK